MGAFWQRFLSCSIIPLLLVICESFPYVKRGRRENLNVQNTYNGFTDDVEYSNKNKNMVFEKAQKMYELERFNAITNMLERDLHNSKSFKSYNSVHRRTENAISKIINKRLANKTEMQSVQSTTGGYPVGRTSNTSNFKSEFVNYIISSSLSNAKHKSSNVRVNEYPNNSKRDRPMSELRRRRSQSMDDFILSGGSDGNVIFGAHTTPCDHADRHYCLNGGTCLYVPALLHKTCR